MTASTEPAGVNNPHQGCGEQAPSGTQRGSPPDQGTVLTAVGVSSVMLGGLVAAVTGPLELAHGSWLAAYLVLVGGVAQATMGQPRFRRAEVTQPRRGWVQIGSWNLGNAMVIGGTLTGVPPAVDLGSVALIIALAIAFHAARPSPGASAPSTAARTSPLLDGAYRALLLVLACSVPVGILLSHLHHS
jgi:hypothetical protein